MTALCKCETNTNTATIYAKFDEHLISSANKGNVNYVKTSLKEVLFTGFQMSKQKEPIKQPTIRQEFIDKTHIPNIFLR